MQDICLTVFGLKMAGVKHGHVSMRYCPPPKIDLIHNHPTSGDQALHFVTLHRNSNNYSAEGSNKN